MLNKIVIFLFSTCIWIISFVWMTFICLLVFTYRLTGYRPIMRLSLHLFSYNLYFTLSRVQVIYHPQFDKNRASVFCQNHVSILDAFAAAAAIKTIFCGVMHGWQFKIPIYGWLMKWGRGIPIDKNKKNKVSQLVSAFKQRKQEDISILTFPEGTRTRDGKIHDFRMGMFLAAREAGYPIVPLAVHGLFEINRAKTYSFKPGKVTIWVGPQFETKGLNDDELKALSIHIKEMIENFL